MLVIGHDQSVNPGNGSVLQSGGTLAVTDRLILGDAGTTGTYHMTDGTFTVGGTVMDNGTSSIQIDNGTMTVAGGLSVDTLSLATAGGATVTATLNVTGADVFVGTGTENFLVGRNAGSHSGTTATGVVDLTGATSATFNVNLFHLGVKGDNSDGVAVGQVTLATDNTIYANEIKLGRAGNNGGPESGLHLGSGTNTIITPTLIVGEYKGVGRVDIASGGTVNLGDSSNRVEITVGLKNASTGGSNASTIDFSAGTAHIYAGNVNLGQESNSGGTGNPTGSLVLGSGTLDVSGNIWEGSSTTGDGTSNLTVGQATVVVAGDLSVDNLSVAGSGGTGTITVGGDVRIGSGTGSNMGLANTTTAPSANGIADFSGADSVTIDVGSLKMGTGTDTAGSARGELQLSATGPNSVTASSIVMGDSDPAGNSGVTSQMVLGGSTNDFSVNSFIIGQSKSNAEVTILPGGVFNLAGKAGGKTNLTIGLQDHWTGGGSNGTLDLSGGTFNATLGTLKIAEKEATGAGTTVGSLTMDAGHVTADSILLANRNGNGNTIATFNFNGGTIEAGLIDEVDGTANFNWTGGTLSIDHFGFDLLQNGSTTVLAPGNSPGTTVVDGSYTLASGTLQIDIEGTTADTGYDQVVIGDSPSQTYDVTLGSAQLELVFGDTGWLSTAGDDLWIINNQTSGVLNGVFDNYPTGGAVASYEGRTWYLYYEADFDTRALAGGNDVLLTSVPEPSTVAMLLGLGGVGLLGWMRRRRQS